MPPFTAKYSQTCADAVVKVLTAGGTTQVPDAIPSTFEVSFVVTVTLEPPADELILNVNGAEFWPLLDTVTEAVPAEAIKLALTGTVTCVELTTVTFGRFAPFH